MIKNLPERINVEVFMIQTGTSMSMIIKMFLENTIRFYRDETLLTFSDDETIFSNTEDELSEDALLERKQQQFEAGLLSPDFDDKEDMKSLLIAKEDIEPWFQSQSIIFSPRPEYLHLWKKQTNDLPPQQTAPPSNMQTWEEKLQHLKNINPIEHKHLLAYFMKYWEDKQIVDIEDKIGVTRRTIHKYINEGRNVAKRENLSLPLNDKIE